MGQRMRAHAELLIILFVMVALLTASLTGSRALLDQAMGTALTDTVAGATPDDRVLIIQTRYADPDQRESGTAAITAALPGAQVHTAIRTPALPLAEYDRERLTLTDDPALPGAARLTSGSWPTEPGQTAIQELAAAALDLDLGDELTVSADGSELALTVTGTWAPADLDDSIWGQDPAARTGIDPSAASAFGPAFVTEATLTDLDTAPFLRWRIVPSAITTDQVPTWLRALPGLPDTLADEGLSHRGITAAGGLETTLGHAQDSLRALHGVTPIPYLLLTISGIIALWQVFNLLRLQRGTETIILRARGASLGTLTWWAAAEGALVAAPAAALGAGISMLIAPHPSPWLIAALLTAGVVAMAVATGLPRMDLPGRRLTSALPGAALALLVGLAGFTLWRLLRAGGTLIPGTARLDVLAASAPAAAVIAVAGMSVALAGPLLGGVSRLAARTRGLSPALETRLAARRGVGASVVVLLVVVASTVTLATTYWGTWQHLRNTSEQVSAGADVVVTGTMTAAELEALRAVPGVTGAAGVFTATYSAAEGDGQLTAITPKAFAATSAPASIFDPELGEQLGGAFLTGPRVDGPQVSAEVTVAADPATEVISPWRARTFALSVWAWNGEIAQRVPLGQLSAEATPVTETLTGDLPGPGPWQIVAVDTLLDVRANPTEFTVDIDIEGADFDGFTPGIIPPPGGEYTATGPLGFTATLIKDTADFEVPGVPTPQRFMPERGPGEVPVAITPGWQGPAATTAIRVSGVELMAEPVAELPVIPGNPSRAGILADTGAISEALLRGGAGSVSIDQAWVAADDPRAAARAIGSDRVHAASSSWAALSILAPQLFLAMAALALVLAAPALLAAGMSELRGRRSEAVVLRAVGAGPRAQARYRRREFGLIFALAIAIGAAAGGALSWAISASLIRSTTPQVSAAVPIHLRIDAPTTAAFTLAVAGLLAAITWWYGRTVIAQVRDPLWREEG